MNKESIVQVAVSLTVLAVVASACSPTSPTIGPRERTAAPASVDTTGIGSRPPNASDDRFVDLLAAAKKEGTLTTIGLRRDWCNYGEALETFKAKYGLEINELHPDAGFGDQLEAIRGNKGNKGPQAPDVIDIGMSLAALAKRDGLIAPYKVTTWDTIPSPAKDPEGYWYGGYYGVLAFEVNKVVVTDVPQDWADLLAPSHKSQVALAGDPRVGNQAIQTVYAAGLGSGGSLDNAQPGLDFFRKLNDAGNFLPTIAKTSTIDQRTTPITLRWTYHALKHRDEANGDPPIDVIVPKSGRLGGVNIQAISAFAPHPNAAELWMEFLYSDEGQKIWLEGYCHPIRFDDLSRRNVIPADIQSRLSDTVGVAFPTLDQLDRATDLITMNWDRVVGADVK